MVAPCCLAPTSTASSWRRVMACTVSSSHSSHTSGGEEEPAAPEESGESRAASSESALSKERWCGMEEPLVMPALPLTICEVDKLIRRLKKQHHIFHM